MPQRFALSNRSAIFAGALALLLSLSLAPTVARAEDPEVFSDPPPLVNEPPAKVEKPKPGEERIDLEELFPPDGRIANWKRTFPESTGYADWQLDQIVGVGAELYREYDVEEMRTLDYDLEGGAEISIELFRTGKSDGAYGLYSIFNAMFGDEVTPILTNVIPPSKGDKPGLKLGEVHASNKNVPPMAADNYRIYPGQGAEFFKGRVYGRIRVFGPIEDMHMLMFTSDILDRIPRDAPRPAILRDLPKPGKIVNSTRYVVGEVSVQELSFPVPADLWGLSGSARAATARYRYGAGESYDVLVTRYNNATWATSRFQSVKDFLSADSNFAIFPTSGKVPQPFVVAKDLTTEKFVGLQLKVDQIYFFSGVANAGLFDKILTTGTQISVREP
jgi:hypothetical protein